MFETKSYSLGEVTTNFDARRVPIKAVDRRQGRFLYYGASGVVDYVDGYLFDGEYLLIAEDGENLRTRKTPIAFMAAGKFWVNNHAHVVQGNHLANTRYLCYALANTDISGYLSGSTQPKLTQAALNSIKLRLPSQQYQDAVIRVLGALDNKIAVNERIADAAEDLSLALASEELWEVRVPLGDLVEHMREQVTPTSIDAVNVAHYSLPAYDQGKLPEITQPGDIKSAKFRVGAAAVLLSKLNPATPRVWNVDPDPSLPALASTEFLVLEPKLDIRTAELWAVCNQAGFCDDLAGKATGTSNSHQRAKPSDILASQVVDPRSMDVGSREQIVSLCWRAKQARIESKTLAELRGTLLPGLMSGAIRVRDAEKAVEDAT